MKISKKIFTLFWAWFFLLGGFWGVEHEFDPKTGSFQTKNPTFWVPGTPPPAKIRSRPPKSREIKLETPQINPKIVLSDPDFHIVNEFSEPFSAQTPFNPPTCRLRHYLYIRTVSQLTWFVNIWSSSTRRGLVFALLYPKSGVVHPGKILPTQGVS